MAMSKIKKGDKVIVLAGKDKGRTGVVLSVNVEKKKAFVEGIQLVKKCQKANPNKGQEAGIITKEDAIDMSNLALVNPSSGKADRVGFKILEDGKKVRVFKSNDEVVDI